MPPAPMPQTAHEAGSSEPSPAEEAIDSVLSELARSHPLVVLCGADDRITWVHDRDGELGTGPDGAIGRRLCELVSTSPSTASDALELESFPVRSLPGASVAIGRRRAAARDAATRMRGSAELLASILDGASDPVIAADLGGFVTFANAAAEPLLGVPARELVGRPLLSCIPPSVPLAEILSGLRTQDLGSAELTIASPDGARDVSISARPLRLPSGEPIGHVAFLRDVTAQRNAERALKAKSDELESYVGHVSHDLRTPLVSVLGFARLLREDYAAVLGHDGSRFVERIEQAGRTMEALIEDLLELARIGNVDECDSLVDPLGVIQQVIADHKPRIDAQDVEIAYPAQPPMLLCNRTRVYQLFSNLIGNALVHMGPVDAPRIEISVDADAALTRIRVNDNGVGIAPELHERIFDVCHSAGTRSDGRRSTGIGLAIVRKIAQQHGGRAWVESAPGEGATFHVTLRAAG